jgi:hypothetical protein
MSDPTINNVPGDNLPLATQDAPADWRGMTLEELRRARGKALVRREVGRATMQYDLDGLKTNFETNGVRALMFKPGTVNHLKKADYLLLGIRLARWLMNMRSSRRHRR